MSSTSAIRILPGSDRPPMDESHSLGPVDPQQQIEVTVVLRAALAAPETGTSGAAAVRPILSREAFARERGASPAAIAAVSAYAQRHGLVVVSYSIARRNVVLAGTAAAFASAFGARLEEYECPSGSYRAQLGPLRVPDDIADLIEGVFGLDDRPQASPRFQLHGTAQPAPAPAASGAFTPPQVASLYQFPTGLDGSGQCIGIIELGGGSRAADLKVYFGNLGLPVPTVKSISVDHGKNRPSTPNGADAEVMLDIEVAAAIAPKALIAVYFAPNTDRGFLDAISTAVHDQLNRPSVISISWGAPEVQWSAQAMAAFEQLFADAAALGVTICCACGDNGSSDGVKDGHPHVDFPASAPHALACGGTRLVAANGVVSETVWNAGPNSATGGGFSNIFARPAYQQQLNTPQTGRGVPDIAGNADPASGYRVRVDGFNFVVGGTSAVAPLWAGLVALLNQRLGHPVGFINPLLYGPLVNSGATRDIVSGNNGAEQAGPGWDACTGWGSPVGKVLLAALGG